MYPRVVVVAVLGLLCACGGGDSHRTTMTIPQADPSINAPSTVTAPSVQLGLRPTSATLPVVSGIIGTLLFAAVGTPATITLSASATAPAGVALKEIRRAQSETLTVYEYFTCVSPTTVSLPSLPAITLNFPASTPLAGKSVYYGVSDLNAQGGLVSFNTHGPGTLVGQTVSFAQVPTSIVFEANHKYTFVVYATGTATAQVAASKIYVANQGANDIGVGYVRTYSVNGAASTPTITGLDSVVGVAVDAAGQIYVAHNNCFGEGCANGISTFNANGAPSTPAISRFANALGVAVDAAGKIYAASDDGTVTTYDAAGTPIIPTISVGLTNPKGVAVDAAGKIYVTNGNAGTTYSAPSLTTYNPDGTRTTPTITAGLHDPVGVAVDASGKIYVANQANNSVTTYNADGSSSTPTITVGLHSPQYLAVDAAGKIYVVNNGNNTVTTYNPNGTRTTPTITTGLSHPFGIAIH